MKFLIIIFLLLNTVSIIKQEKLKFGVFGSICTTEHTGLMSVISSIFQIFKPPIKCDINKGLTCINERCQCPPSGLKYWSVNSQTCAPCPDEWIFKNNSCYYYSKFIATWFDARKWCKGHNSTLLVINDQFEFDFIMSLVPICPTTYYWVGLNDLDKVFDFVWEDGRHINETHPWFEPGQPQKELPAGNDGCVDTCGTSKYLCNWNCTDPSNFICETQL